MHMRRLPLAALALSLLLVACNGGAPTTRAAGSRPAGTTAPAVATGQMTGTVTAPSGIIGNDGTLVKTAPAGGGTPVGVAVATDGAVWLASVNGAVVKL